MLRVLVTALLTLTAAASVASAAGASEAAVAFNAYLSGHAAFTGLTTVSFTGQGSATVMGPVSNDGRLTVTGVSLGCVGGLPNTNVETLTAADGDTLIITSHDLACLAGVLQFRGTGTWDVTGGTGRFSDATGHGTAVGGADFVAGTFAMTLTGTVAG